MDKNRVKNGMIPITPLTKKSHRQEILKRIENVDWAIVSVQINHQLQTQFLNCEPSSLRLLAEPTSVEPVQGAYGAQERSVHGVHEHPSTGATKQLPAEGRLCKKPIIAGFSQHKDEPDIMPFLRLWHQQGGTCCLPVVVASEQPLLFRVWDLEKPLVKGSYGIWVPAETAPEIIPDVVLTPLVAFDRQGSRLGRGAGYYDRKVKALRNQNPKIQIIGVAAHQQFIEFLETEPHDEPLDGVVTDKEILRFR